MTPIGLSSAHVHIGKLVDKPIAWWSGERSPRQGRRFQLRVLGGSKALVTDHIACT